MEKPNVNGGTETMANDAAEFRESVSSYSSVNSPNVEAQVNGNFSNDSMSPNSHPKIVESPKKLIESPQRLPQDSPQQTNVESPVKSPKAEYPPTGASPPVVNGHVDEINHDQSPAKVDTPIKQEISKEIDSLKAADETEEIAERLKSLVIASPTSPTAGKVYSNGDHQSPSKVYCEAAVALPKTPVVSPSSAPKPPLSADFIHQVKWITWHGAKTPVVTQNENGPCPLLAAMNVLLLRGQVTLPDEMEVVTAQNLIERLGDCIIRLTPKEFAHRPDYQQNISDAIQVLPKLMTGLDVNVKFTGVSDFEYTPECVVFDLLNIPLYHGWLVEPDNVDLASVVGPSSYNQLVEKIIESKCSGDSAKVSQAILAEQFLETTASQLTYFGLHELNNKMKEGELAVFFRNNHFSTLIKHEVGLYLLVTDQGFISEKSVVWETLNNVGGDSQFVDAEFIEVPPKKETKMSPAPLAENASPQEQIDHDLMVAMSLDENGGNERIIPIDKSGVDSDLQLALQLQQEENNRAAANEVAEGGGAPVHQQNAHSPTGSVGKKKDKCDIL